MRPASFTEIQFLSIGVIRLVQYLSQNHLLGKERSYRFVLDAGTGTTAVGLGIGAICLGCVLDLHILQVETYNLLARVFNSNRLIV